MDFIILRLPLCRNIRRQPTTLGVLPPQYPINRLLQVLGGLEAHQTAHFAPRVVKHDHCRRTQHIVLAGFFFAFARTYVYVDDLEIVAVFILYPAHDGLYALADVSGVRVEIEHTRLSTQTIGTATAGHSNDKQRYSC